MNLTPRNYDVIYKLLEMKTREYNRRSFIAHDPIAIPHRFSKLQDIEIAGFLTAVLAWGNRTSILRSGNRLMQLMDEAPYDFIVHHREKDLKPFLDFKHRNFQPTDILYFIAFLRQHYSTHPSLEAAFLRGPLKGDVESALVAFHQYFFSLEEAPLRTRKHVPTPLRGSACKKLNMFLRWMVRKDRQGVDFGLWKHLKPAQLLIPLDVHVNRTALQLGLLTRKASDWQAVVELTNNLKKFDPDDPVKYDYALFGLSILDKMNIH